MQIVAEPRQEAKDLAKMILCADDQSVMWFNIGCWYADCLWTAVLTLPDGDPALAQMVSGQVVSREGIAQNMLRIEIAREETAEFMRNLPAPVVLLARASLHRPAASQASEATQAHIAEVENALVNFWLMTLKIAAGFFRLLPSIGWMMAKRRLRDLIKRE